MTSKWSGSCTWLPDFGRCDLCSGCVPLAPLGASVVMGAGVSREERKQWTQPSARSAACRLPISWDRNLPGLPACSALPAQETVLVRDSEGPQTSHKHHPLNSPGRQWTKCKHSPRSLGSSCVHASLSSRWGRTNQRSVRAPWPAPQVARAWTEFW